MVNWCKSNLFWFFLGSYRFIFADPVVLCGSHCNSADVARQSEKLAVRCQVSGHQRSQSQSSYGHLGKMRGLISVWVNMFIPWYPEKPSLDDSLKKSALFDRLIMQWSFQWSSTTSVWCLFRPSTAAVSLLLRSIMLRVTICGLKWCSICQGQTKQVRCNLGLTPTWGEQDWTNCGKLLSRRMLRWSSFMLGKCKHLHKVLADECDLFKEVWPMRSHEVPECRSIMVHEQNFTGLNHIVGAVNVSLLKKAPHCHGNSMGCLRLDGTRCTALESWMMCHFPGYTWMKGGLLVRLFCHQQGFISDPCPVCTQSEMLDVRNESQSASSFIKKLCASGLAQRAVVVLWRLVLFGSYDLWCGNTVRVVFVSYVSIYFNPLFL